MSSQTGTTWLTPEEYLAIERQAEWRSEYIDGVMYAMAGSAFKHAQIVSNLITGLGLQLRNRDCSVLAIQMKVRLPDSKKFFYPDLAVVCGKPQFHDEETDVILNPMLLIEVFSESTEFFDRGWKFKYYQQLDSLREYLLVAQDRVAVEQFIKQANGAWLYATVADRESSLPLPSIECALDLSAVYDKVDWKEYERSSNDDE